MTSRNPHRSERGRPVEPPSGLAVLGVTLMLGGGVQLWREANMAVRSLDLMLAEHDERLRGGESN